MKQEQDKFTIDAFSAPRRGRPAVLHPLTNAERQRNYRRRLKTNTDELVQAKTQLAYLKSVAKKLQVMSEDWRDINNFLVDQVGDVVPAFDGLIQTLTEFIAMNGSFD